MQHVAKRQAETQMSLLQAEVDPSSMDIYWVKDKIRDFLNEKVKASVDEIVEYVQDKSFTRTWRRQCTKRSITEILEQEDQFEVINRCEVALKKPRSP